MDNAEELYYKALIAFIAEEIDNNRIRYIDKGDGAIDKVRAIAKEMMEARNG